MKNEKIFNAMEYLDDKYIAEAMEQYESCEYIDLQGEEPVDPYSEGVIFDNEIANEKNKGIFIKWAGLAAGACVTAASALIIIKGGYLSLPHSTLSDNTQASQTTDAPDEADERITDVNALKENFNLWELNITDTDLIGQIESARAVPDGDKLYFVKQPEDLKKAAVCTYDIKENTFETVFEKAANGSDEVMELKFLCTFGGSLYYLETVYNMGGDCTTEARICICKYDVDQKTHRDIFALPTPDEPYCSVGYAEGRQIIGTVKAAGKYLFFENGEYINFKKKVAVYRYDMESGETVIFKENAEIFDVWEDKLLFIRHDAGEDYWRLISCDAASGENEETLRVFSDEIEPDSVCFDGNTLWAVQIFGKRFDDVKENARFGFDIKRLNESKEFDTVEKVYDIAAYRIKSVQNLIVSDRCVYDTQNGESIITDRRISLSVIGDNLYCFDRSDSETEVYMLLPNPSTIA